MAKRDRLKEIMDIKARSGRRGGRFPSTSDLHQLRDLWSGQVDSRELLASLLPARMVTLLEVFGRYWIQRLIDHGTPYVERAIDLKADIKYDFALARTLHGQSISLGLLVSNSVPLSSIESLSSCLSTLLNRDFFDWLSKAQGRLAIEHHGSAAESIIKDVKKTRRELARLFEVRHVLVHEFPENAPVDVQEVDALFDACDQFMDAADEGFSQLLYGMYPISQSDMNMESLKNAEASRANLAALNKLVEEKTNSSEIFEVQKKWEKFCAAEAARIASPWEGGSMRPLVENTATEVIVRDRIAQLQAWLEGEFDETE